MFDKLKKCYSGKKVFLTGHTGFKGSWLLKLLTMLGANVKGYALSPNNKDDLFNVIQGNAICDSVIADLRDRDRLKTAIGDFRPDFVFHLAAQPLVRLSYEIPSETFEVNAIGTANLLDGVRELDNKCTLVLITTDKVYQNNEWEYPYRENDRLGGYDPYSASKACTELVINSYVQSFFNNSQYKFHLKDISVVRAGNVIGGGDWSKDRLIPDVARALSQKKEIIIRNPTAIRPWQHVLEPIVAYLILGAKQDESPQKFNGAYNIGPNAKDSLSVKEMLELSVKFWGEGSFRVETGVNQPHEAGLLKLDISKISNKLDWQPKWDASLAVENTMLWYKTFVTHGQNAAKELMQKQIFDYLNRF